LNSKERHLEDHHSEELELKLEEEGAVEIRMMEGVVEVLQRTEAAEAAEEEHRTVLVVDLTWGERRVGVVVVVVVVELRKEPLAVEGEDLQAEEEGQRKGVRNKLLYHNLVKILQEGRIAVVVVVEVVVQAAKT